MSLDFVEALKIAKAKFQAHPHWRRLEGTPWENDGPVIAATLMVEARRPPETEGSAQPEEIVFCMKYWPQREEEWPQLIDALRIYVTQAIAQRIPMAQASSAGTNYGEAI